MKNLNKIAALSALAFCASCDDREVSVSIVQMQQLSDKCTAETDDTKGLIRGAVDVALARSYVVYPLVENHMIDLVAAKGYSNTDGRQDTHSVILKKAVYSWTSTNLASSLPLGKQTVELGATIGVQSQAAVGIEVLSSEDMLNLWENYFSELSLEENKPETATLKIKLKGETLDGREVETEDFSFPVSICSGCRIEYPADANDTTADTLPNCLGSAENASSPECPMQVGTDAIYIDCRLCPGYAIDSTAQKLCQPNASQTDIF